MVEKKKSIKIVAILILLISVLLIGRFIRTGNFDGKIIQDEGILKIGVVSVGSDIENKKYTYKEEIITENHVSIQKFITIVNNGKNNRSISLDRLPAEYEINVYYKDKVIKCYYWIQQNQYNLNISGIEGEISINGNSMDALIKQITGEIDIMKLADPY